MSEEEIRSLREALAQSPENVPLILMLAEALMRLGRGNEAEEEYRKALRVAPEEDRARVGLIQAFRFVGKRSEAKVLIEEMLGRSTPPALAYLWHAKMLFDEGKPRTASLNYRKALELDPSLEDAELEEALKVPLVSGGGSPEAMFDPREEEAQDILADMERPSIHFQHVGGMEEIKDQIRMKIILPLEKPELFEAYGKKSGGGILMYGPPGCGKTYLARATAGEIKAQFLAVGLHDVLDMYIGESERKLHAIFEQARRNTPCVLFFDEVDALGANRADLRKSVGRNLVNQFLSELDGVDHNNEGVLILAATNAPWHVDAAFRRPGRFDRMIFVPPPDQEARAEILRLNLAGKPKGEVDLMGLAKKAPDFSGADLKALVDAAVEAKLLDAMKSGVPEPIELRDLKRALKALRPSTKEWFSTARNYALYSNESGAYDDILDYLGLKK